MYNNQYFTMQGYGFVSYSILGTLAQILLFVSVTVFILSMAMYFIKKSNTAENGQERPSNISDVHRMICSECGFKMQIEWQCCPSCGNDGIKHDTVAEEAGTMEFVTPIEETQASEPEISDVVTAPPEELQEVEQVDRELVIAPVVDIQESVQANSVEIVTPVIEIQREEQEHVKSVELDDVVERIYQVGKEKSNNNGKNTKQNSKSSKNQKEK